MSFSYPAGSAGANAETYVRGLLDLLDGRDPLEVQARLIDSLERAIEGLDDAQLRTPEAPGKWSVVEVVQHLADIEIVYGYRYRTVLGDDEPAITGFDQDGWAGTFGYREADLNAALAQIGLMRETNLRLLRTLTQEQRDRVGHHTERGPESLWRTVELVAAHDLVHLAQIERIKAAIL